MTDMARNALLHCNAGPQNKNYDVLCRRKNELYLRDSDIRTEYMRDYTRIIHCQAYRRLKHKTQVFFNPVNDHICTRMEHVLHVDSVSNTISAYLGLDTDLTHAIAMGHDLGHAPFGHQGEDVIKELSKKYLAEDFWHEKNGIRFTDYLELLEDDRRMLKNLSLTYAVRDGIISHCGEIDENGLKPRDPKILPEDFSHAGDYQPATWEGCIVKLSDKIAYLGRDIDDAINMGFLSDNEMRELNKIAMHFGKDAINTTVIMQGMICDVCENTTADSGITLSRANLELMNEIKRFNYEYIYHNKKLEPFRNYSRLLISEIFYALLSRYDGAYTLFRLEKDAATYPQLLGDFALWLAKYCTLDLTGFDFSHEIAEHYDNEKIYGKLEDETTYIRAVIDYISGMTDRYAIRLFDELISY